MITQLTITNFKGFAKYRLHCSGDAFLVGPNNAGKSSLIEALRVCAQMLRYARRRAPTDRYIDQDTEFRAYPFDPNVFDLVTENLRFEMRREETRIELQFTGRHKLKAVWPRQSDEAAGPAPESGFYYLQYADGRQPARPKEVREGFPYVGVIPVLAPVEPNEEVLTDEYLRKNLDSRLASRHFRNQLLLLQSEWDEETLPFDDYLEFVKSWAPELRIKELVRSGTALDLYYEDSASRVEKEFSWAGDGMQIWLQLLLHLYRLRRTGASTIVLDEPDVFLHADLQRRLVNLLEGTAAQTITATHSSEVLAEASPTSIIWIDRSRRRATRAPGDALLAELSESLGTQFNLRLAKALTVRLVLFVEGQDSKILRNLARTLAKVSIANETNLAVISLRGFANWAHTEPFAWLVDDFLGRSIDVFVLLDRDYHSDQATKAVLGRLTSAGMHGHVWKRKELESYLIDEATIARVSGADEIWVRSALLEIAESLRYEIAAQFLAQRQQEDPQPKRHLSIIAKEAQKEFDALWVDPRFRLERSPPRELLSSLNARLEETGRRPVSFRRLSQAMTAREIPEEMAQVLARIESLTE